MGQKDIRTPQKDLYKYLRETRKEMGLHTALVYLITDRGFNCDLYTIDIRERIPQWMESNKNEPWTFYTWAEWEVLAN